MSRWTFGAGVLSLTGAALLFFGLAILVPAAGGPGAPDPEGRSRRIDQSLPPLHSVRAMERLVAEARAGERRIPGYLESYLWWYRQRAYPFDTLDWGAYSRAELHRDRMPQAGPAIGPGSVGPLVAASWQFVGPRRLAAPFKQFFGDGPLGGRVNGVAFHPTNSSIYFLASASGGAWKSTDRGITWSPLSDGWQNLLTSSITLDPTNGEIVYVGTGDYDKGRGSLGHGVMKSTNGGATWTQLGAAGMMGYAIRAVLVDPENPSVVTVTTGRGGGTPKIWRSTNGGATWNSAFDAASQGGADADWSDLAVGARTAATGVRFYYAVGNRPNGSEVWRSADRGASWTKLNPPLGALVDPGALDVATSPVSPRTVYLLAGGLRQIFRSTDAGANWTLVNGNFPDGAPDANGTPINWSQAGYDFHITCARHTNVNADVVYAGLIDLAASRTGGGEWSSIGETMNPLFAKTHNDQHCMAVNPNNRDEMLVGNDGGIYRMTFNSFFGSWDFQSLNAGLGITEFYQAAFHPANSARMVGGTQDNATPVATGDLTAWQNRIGGDGGFAAVNPLNPAIQFGTAQNLDIRRTDNEWFLDFPANAPNDFDGERRGFIAPIAIDPSVPNRLYAGTNFLWRRNDADGVWTPRLGNQVLAGPGSVVTYIAVSPTDPNRIHTGSSDGQVWMSRNAGSTWTRLDNLPTTSLPDRFVTSIAVNPLNPNEILVSLSGTQASHVWRMNDTTSANRAWASASGAGLTGLPDIPVNSVAYDPSTVTRYYVGTDVGVFLSHSSGRFWSNATRPLGLPNVQVNRVEVVPGTGFLMAATFGRGMWRINRSFDPPVFSISGRIAFANGTGLAGVSVQSGSASTVTAANGTYTLPGLLTGDHVVVPSAATATFTPATRTVTVTTQNVTGVNFTASPAFKISGKVSRVASTQGISGVTVTAGGKSSTTNSLGNYVILAVPPGTHGVKPTKSGFTFSPTSRTVTVGPDKSGVNFTGSPPQ